MKKIIIKSHTINAGTALGSYEKRLDLGVEVKKVLGYYIQVLDNGGLAPEKMTVSYSNGQRTIFEPVTLAHLTVSSSVPIKDRFFREDSFDVPGKLVTTLSIPSAPGADVTIQHVLLVETN